MQIEEVERTCDYHYFELEEEDKSSGLQEGTESVEEDNIAGKAGFQEKIVEAEDIFVELELFSKRRMVCI